MVDAKPGADQHDERKRRKTRDQPRPRRLPRGRDRDQGGERNADVVRDALLEAERAGRQADHELEEVGAENRRRADDRDDDRGHPRRLVGAARSVGSHQHD